MSQRPHTVHNGNRNLSHDESEELLSARQDAPIDPVENRALLAHLQGCASCRAFAIQLEVMSRELETLPRLAASPTVRREVHVRIQAPQPFWSRLTTSSSSGGMRAVPAALSALVVLVALAAFVMIRLGDSEPGGVANDPGAIDAPIDQALVLSPVATATVDSQAALMEEIPVEPTATARVVTVNTSTPASTETTTASSALEPRDAATGASSASEPDPSATGTAAPTRTPPGLTSRPGEDGEPEPTPAPSSTATSAPQLAQVTQTPDVDSILAAALGPPQTPEPGAAAAGAGGAPEATATSGAQVPGGDGLAIAAAEVDESTATPTSTPTAPPTETATPEPTATPTLESTATAIPEPAFTFTPEPTATSTPEPTSTPTLEPAATATIEPSATSTATSTEETIFAQPTIAPKGASEAEAAESTGITTQEEIATGESESSPPIQPATGSAGSAGAEEDPTAEVAPSEGEIGIPATEETTGEAVGGATASLLDQADVVATLGGGISAPIGRMEFGPAINWYVVTLSDGSMGVANSSGSILASLGAGSYPIWSPQGLVLLYADVSGAYSSVATWDAQSGQVYFGGASSERAVSDIPAGWLGNRYYYQRTFPDSPGEIEVRSANWDGSDDQLIWAGTDVSPVTARPVVTELGITIATSAGWLVIGANGSVSNMGGAAFGSVSAPIVSPGGSLIAYSADGMVYVANINNPGSPVGTGIPYAGGFGSGYAFATSGEELVVSSAGGLSLYTIFGVSLGSAASSVTIAAPYWVEDRIYFLEVGDITTLRVISASSIIN